jgi:signal transduction histidine kinase
LPVLDRAARGIGLRLTDEHRAQVLREQMRMVLLHTRIGTLAATAFALMLALYVQTSLAPGETRSLVILWIVVKLVVAAARMALARVWARHPREPAEDRHWQAGMLALLGLDGLVWGIGGWALMSQPVAMVALVMAALDGVSCVATFGLQVRLAATAAYVLPMLLPMVIGLSLHPDDFSHYAALGQILLAALLIATSRAASLRLTTGLLLQLQARELAAEKEAALRLAEEKSAERQRFLAKVSHELRTPLHGMLGIARLLQLDAREPLLQHRLGLIDSSGTQLLSLIDDLLDVSRIQAGRFALKVERFDLSALLDELAELFSLRAADKGLAFEVYSRLPRPHPVHGDAVRLRQVLNNLLGNAVKFTQAGRVSLRVVPGAGPDTVAFAVVDTGPGIGRGEFSRIFQPFEQVAPASGSAAHGGLASTTDGVGLGLTIAREIAQAMGSDIEVKSEPGQGSTFGFVALLPAGAGPAPDDDAVPPARLPSPVLVAEDDELNLLIVGAYLDSLGVRYERAADGRQAVDAALRDGGRPELVLMDCRMPVMNGLEATREIRREEARRGWPRLPVLALTATATEAERNACLAVGMDEVITKPFTRQQLSDALRQAGRARPAG